MLVDHIHDTIGRTPIVKLNRINDTESSIYIKLEWFNPGGSVKDRIALSMIEDAEDRGLLQEGSVIVEPSSGNTGIGLAMVAASKGYKLIITMPETVSEERRKILQAYGTVVHLTPREKGMKGAIEKAEELKQAHDAFMPMQFKNPENPSIHARTTAQEIVEDFDHVDVFVVGVGTGGTLSGAGRTLKEQFSTRNIAVEPSASAVLSGDEGGPHKIQGVGAGFIPDILDTSIYEDIIRIDDDEALEMARRLAKEEGLFVGISTGANVAAALKVARNASESMTILTISPSNGERYLSTDLFNEV